MKIISYKYCDYNGLEFPNIRFQDVNLIVGYTGSGKTRFLNSLFDLGKSAVNEILFLGTWEIEIIEKGKQYKWFLYVQKEEDNKVSVCEEKLSIMKEDGQYEVILSRNSDEFTFKNNPMPKLSKNLTCIKLLQEEEGIKDLFEGFRLIQRRDFAGDVLTFNSSFQDIDPKVAERIKKSNDPLKLFHADVPLNTKLLLMDYCSKNIFKKVCEYYQKVFPFIENIEFRNVGILDRQIPILSMKEKGVNNWILLNELSSGMLKVLLIIVDILLLPKNGIYLLDEYENSLGVNAIDFFPALLLEEELNQIFISSHHPYLINKIPIEKWYVFHRKGSSVRIKYGEALISRIGKSKQQAFIKLMNDSFYNEGEE